MNDKQENVKTYNISDKDKKEYVILSCFAGAIHVMFTILGYFAGMYYFTIYSLLTVIFYIIITICLAKNVKFEKCLLACVVEVATFALIGSVTTGYSTGFTLYTLAFIPYVFHKVYVFTQNAKKAMIIATCQILWYHIMIFVSIHTTDIFVTIPYRWIKVFHCINSVIAGVLLFAFFTEFMRIVNMREKALARENAKLKDEANFDPLTKLLNRRTFDYQYLKYMDNILGTHGTFCIAMFDIDDFKHVNDTYGHDAGDDVLKRIAEILANSLRSEDMVFRWGGEEFLMLLKCDKSAAINVINRCIDQIAKSDIITEHDGTLNVTISAGLTEYVDGVTSSDLISLADDALYESKNNGKNRLTVA